MFVNSSYEVTRVKIYMQYKPNHTCKKQLNIQTLVGKTENNWHHAKPVRNNNSELF